MKKKLIELISSTEYGNGSLVGKNFQKGFIEKIADHLIANGVTIPVRCKECKYYDEKDEDCNHPGLWAEYASDFGLGMYPDDFCSIGERRNDGV